MPTHKFHIRSAERDGEFGYRVKSVNEPHERVVREGELSDVS
jgi:hypothetical protein